ncbi:hypothetical protein POTOM_038370 [Populus tomentosa]|uniref:SPX domain-containing protein n=1 Tax=Populus tomentosa TaxID=118781 RepID=A0A8X7YYK0_POPTO|nr:hypothetical protein POTOM_038370 [Populus tomentosa]
MALRLGMLKCAAEGNNGCRLGIKKWTHVVAMAPPLDGALESSIAAPQFTLPEFDANQDTSNNSSDFGFTFPGFSFGGSMELMAVPKRKVAPHKRGVVVKLSCHTSTVAVETGGRMVSEIIEQSGGLNLQSTNLSSKGDIEDQVIDVNALPQDDCRKSYTTGFLRESEEGEELVNKFFKKLDEQLNKFSSSYKEKLDEMKHEASLLNKQMNAFIALRIKVESPGFGESCAKKSYDTGVVTTNALKSYSPSRDTPSGLEDMDVGCGVEMSNDLQPEKSTYEQSEVNEINATKYGNAHQEKDNLIDYEEDPLKILEREKINNSLKSPLPTIKGVFKDSKE